MTSGRKNGKACMHCREKRKKCIRVPDNRCQLCIEHNVSTCEPYKERKRGRKSKLERLALEHPQEDQHDLSPPCQAAKGTRTASMRVKATFAFIPNFLPARPPSPPASVMSVVDATERTPSPGPVWTFHASNQEAIPGDDVYAPASPEYPVYDCPLLQPMVPTQQADAFFPEVPLMDPVVFGHYTAAQPLAELHSIPEYRFTFDPVDYDGTNPWPRVLPQLTAGAYYMNMPSEGIDIESGLGLYPVTTSLDDVTNYNSW